MRFNKILSEEGISNTLSDNIYNEVDRQLRMNILNLDYYYNMAYTLYKPHYIAEYLYNLATSLNNFYQSNHIKGSLDNVKNDWLYIISLSTRIIKEMLSLLAIQIPSKM